MTEDEMVGWHHQLNDYEFEQTPGYSEEQGSLVCCHPQMTFCHLQKVICGWQHTVLSNFLPFAKSQIKLCD